MSCMACNAGKSCSEFMRESYPMLDEHRPLIIAARLSLIAHAEWYQVAEGMEVVMPNSSSRRRRSRQLMKHEGVWVRPPRRPKLRWTANDREVGGNRRRAESKSTPPEEVTLRFLILMTAFVAIVIIMVAGGAAQYLAAVLEHLPTVP